MSTSFKIKLRMPTSTPDDHHSGAWHADEENGDRSDRSRAESARAASASFRAAHSRASTLDRGSSVADEGSSLMSEDAGEEMDELEDSPPPPQRSSPMVGSGTVRKLSGAAAMKAANNLKRAKLEVSGGGSGSGGEGSNRSVSGMSTGTSSPPFSTLSAAAQKRRAALLTSLGKPIEDLSIEEIEALPAAKRRKTLKARGAAGPGRGWRKGLKMDQKPVYRQPGGSPPAAVAPGTPSSFSRPKSALARDAMSKTSTPVRSESPYSRGSPMDESTAGTGADDVAPVRTFSASHAAVAARRARAAAEEAAAAAQVPAPAPAKVSAPSQQDEGRAIKAIIRGGPSVLPPPKIPIGFVTVTPLYRSGSSKPVRKWQRRGREILSLGGRPWSAVSWISNEPNHFPTSAEMKASASSSGVNTATSVSGAAAAAAAATTTTTTTTTTAPASTAGAVTGRALSPAMGATPLPANGAATPMLASRTASPMPGHAAGNLNSSPLAGKVTSTAASASVNSSPISSSANLSKPKQTSATAVTPTAADWKGSSAAFAAANRGRS